MRKKIKAIKYITVMIIMLFICTVIGYIKLGLPINDKMYWIESLLKSLLSGILASLIVSLVIMILDYTNEKEKVLENFYVNIAKTFDGIFALRLITNKIYNEKETNIYERQFIEVFTKLTHQNLELYLNIRGLEEITEVVVLTKLREILDFYNEYRIEIQKITYEWIENTDKKNINELREKVERINDISNNFENIAKELDREYGFLEPLEKTFNNIKVANELILNND